MNFGDVLNLAFAFITGILTGVGAWLVTMRAVRPAIDISPEISRIQPAKGDKARQHLYRVKLRNKRRTRSAIDVEISCRLGMINAFDDRSKNRSNYVIPTSLERLPELKRRAERVLWLHLHEAGKLESRLASLSPDLGRRLGAGEARLEELLALPRARLIVTVRCNDSLSNAPRVVSHTFVTGSVAIGYFESKTTRINRTRFEGYELDELRGHSQDDVEGVKA